MLSKKQATNNKIVQQILSQTKSNQAKEFIQKLYLDVPEEELKLFKIDYLYKSALELYNNFKKRDHQKLDISVFRESNDADFCVLQIISKDAPFLIDSISNELKVQECEIHLITHPVYQISRSSTGELRQINGGDLKEAALQFHISNFLDDARLAQLIKRIRSIMECIYFAVADWKKMGALMLSSVEEIKASDPLKKHEMKEESVLFLEWLVNNHFVFLGAATATIKNNKVMVDPKNKLGLLRSSIYNIKDITVDKHYSSAEIVFNKKWDERSVVHRNAHLDLIVVKQFNKNGKITGANLFFGLFTSTVYYQSVRDIPLMRQKVAKVIQRYGYPESSHNGKELITAMESFPRTELLQMSVDELYETATGIVSISLTPKVKLFLRDDQVGKFISCLVFIPGKNYSSDTKETIERIVSKHLNATVSRAYTQIGESALVRLQLMLKRSTEMTTPVDIDRLEKEIIKYTNSWGDELSSALHKHFSMRESAQILHKYKDAFDVKYRNIFAGVKAIHDIRIIEQAMESNQVRFDIYLTPKVGDNQIIQLKIYSPGKELPLSSTLPIIENLGLFAIDVQTYDVKLRQDNSTNHFYIHHFRLNTKNHILEIDNTLTKHLKTAFEKVWSQETDDDNFNSLILVLNANWREVSIIRAIAKYLKQTEYPLSEEFTLEALLTNPALAKKLIELFNLKFSTSGKINLPAIVAKVTEIKEGLKAIKSIAEDKAIRSILEVIEACKRTNFFQKDSSGHYKNYISFKISSPEVSNLPQPKPYAEIFVYSPSFEAIHLRGGKIARGGIRWSDRKEDYRTEVLGLMKAQMTKNSIIVPVGSKGGFIVKKVSPADGKDVFLNEGIKCYQTFLSGLLDLTDNIINGKIVPPSDVVRHDKNDPYLVVAADKGTASFSDYANQISEKYNFWLGDAFASGGSAGYDHKKMAITARGAWISVERHFEEMGIDIKKQSFTCTGIGDMSGDVFGNGMLLSKTMKVVAAFNQSHIFLDPTPDPLVSFNERLRLFNLPRSQWSDYNLKLLSKGGGIYDRKLKSINISSEVRQALDITDSELAPNELIQAILKAPVDLLWNGGIGTYVKSQSETNERLGDKSNDSLRINGSDLRCKIVAEGGNLGMTQLGRIEFAQHSGRLNTDFIDNSAGVDCSDHEVNLKIALSDLLRSGKLKRKDRDAQLSKMTKEVASLVLNDNFKQTQILTLETKGSNSRINAFAWLIKYLEERKELDRKIEYLPSQEILNKMITEKHMLTRPEVSVLLSYAKNSAYTLLSNHDVTVEAYLEKYLYAYFPSEFSKKYKTIIDSHKLKNEILATVLINDFINTLGCTFFHQAIDDTGVSPFNLVKAFIIVKEVFNIEKEWQKIESLKPEVPIQLRLGLFKNLQELMERNIIWIVHHHKELNNIGTIISQYQKNLSTLQSKIKTIATHSMHEWYNTTLASYSDSKEAHAIAKEQLYLTMLTPTFDIININAKVNRKIEDIAQTYFLLGEQLNISWLVVQAKSFIPRQYFQILALRLLTNEIYDVHMMLTHNRINEGKSKKYESDHYKAKFERYNRFINDLKTGDTTDVFVSKLTIALKKVKELA